jgi:hypothetical protein
MKKIVFSAICVLTIVLSGCSSIGSSPQDVPVKFYKDLSKNEFTKALSYVYYESKYNQNSNGTYSTIRPSFKKILNNILPSISSYMTNRGALTGVKVKSHTINGDSGVVVLDLSFGDGKKDIDVDKIKKVNGKWYMVIVGP